MTRHEAALMIARILNDDYASMTQKAIEALQMGIAALDECSLDEWCTGCKEYDRAEHRCPRFNHVIRKAMREAEQKRWIPCSECMPSDKDYKLFQYGMDLCVLCTNEYGEIGVGYFDAVDGCWVDLHGNEYDVIAWMPLPDY